MKKFYTNCLAILLMATTLFFGPGCQDRSSAEFPVEENEMYDNPDLAAEFEMLRKKDPATGKMPGDQLLLALQRTAESKAAVLNSPNIISALSWTERGSYTDAVGPSNGNTRANGGITSGRIRAAMVDSMDATKKTVWVGGVDGGLWKTTDITTSPANWILVDDALARLSVAAICQDPTDGNIMYFATGESYGNADAAQGAGVFRSTDHGVTWTHLASTISYVYCTRIVCDNEGNIYLGTRGNGLLRSTKASGGAVWTDITPTGIGNRICDLEISTTGGPGRLHVTSGIFTASFYRYTDIPSTVTSGSGWNTPTVGFTSFNQRIELACKGNTLYALPCNASYQVPTIYKSTDGGNTWAATTAQPTSGWASGQGWYSLSADINPANPDHCIVGGLDTHRTLDGGLSWIKISAWVGTTGQYVHADQHKVIWWDGGTKLMFACDGGIHYSSDNGNTIRDRNIGLRLKQFYSCAIHPTSTNYFLAGTQDNGTHQFNSPGLGASVEVTGGDGAFVGIDQDEPQFQAGAYVYSNYRRSSNGGATWSYGPNNGNGQFINPFDYDNLGNKIYAGYAAGQYLRWEDPHSGFTYSPITISSITGSVSAVTVSPYTANRVYFGTSSGRVVQVDNADQATPVHVNLTGGGMTGYLNAISVGSNDQNLIACYSNYGVQNVWVSADGGTTWTASDGNLPNMPVNWVMFHPDDDTKAFIATETGVWETDLLNGGSTVWLANPTFPAVGTDMIRYRPSDRTILAATHGRGLWSAIVPPVGGCTPASITTSPSNSTVCVGGTTSFTVVAGGSAPLTYQWEFSTNGGGTWNNVSNGGVYSGATTPTLNITGALLSMNTYQYRVKVTGNCAPLTATSGAAVLTVNTLPAITGQPSNSTVCAGTTTSFTVAATGTGISYQWQESTNGGVSFTNVSNGGVYSGVTTVTLTLTGVTTGMSGYQYRAVVSGSCTPAATSNAAVLTVNTLPSISQHPSSLTICAGNNAVFSVTAAGGSLTYLWEESTNGGGTWNNISNGGVYSGATTATLTITAAPLSMSGYQYRVTATGTCPPAATSNPATLTVNTALVISSQPANSTLCAGGNTSFAVSITGTVNSYQWQVSTNGGGTWSDLSNGGVYAGVTTANLTLTGVAAGMNGYQYRVVVTGSCPPINSNAATLTVNTAPVVTTSPAPSIICAAQNTSFTVSATGTALTNQWQVSTDGGATWTTVSNGGVYSGATTPVLTITGATVAMNGYQYRSIVSGTCAPAATSGAALLTVYTPATITTQPAAITTICSTGNTSFSVTAAGTTPTYQWQVSINGGATWTNLTNTAPYSGVTTSILSLTGVTTTMSGYLYRVIVSGTSPCGTVTSSNASLVVTPKPSISLVAAPYTKLFPGLTTTLTANTSLTAPVYVWTRNGVVVPNVSGSSLQVTVNNLGDYTVTVTDPVNGCTNTSSVVTIGDSASNKLFIYPSPNDGRFTVAYYNPGGASTNQIITIYDSKGARVYTSSLLVTQAYQLHEMDLRRNGAGIYYVVLSDANGNTLKNGEVSVR